MKTGIRAHPADAIIRSKQKVKTADRQASVNPRSYTSHGGKPAGKTKRSRFRANIRQKTGYNLDVNSGQKAKSKTGNEGQVWFGPVSRDGPSTTLMHSYGSGRHNRSPRNREGHPLTGSQRPGVGSPVFGLHWDLQQVFSPGDPSWFSQYLGAMQGNSSISFLSPRVNLYGGPSQHF